MPTSVHIPRDLLRAVDRRARSLRVSRNRFIVRAVERELTRDDEWSPGFFEALERIEPGDVRALGEMLEEIQSRRSSKKPVRL